MPGPAALFKRKRKEFTPMKFQSAIRTLSLAGMLAATFNLSAQMVEPAIHHDAGDSVTGVFEGWFHNTDGSYSILLGYYNRNMKQELDIPVGSANKIEPGGPDQGQPTHFYPGKTWGNFVIRVPKEFGANKLQWTLTANGKTTVIPLNLKTDWELLPFKDADNNTPPMLSFGGNSKTVQGPVPVTATYKATAGEPLELTAIVADDDIVSPATRKPKVPVSLHWTTFRTPEQGTVTFANSRPVVEKTDGTLPPGMAFMGKAITTATFSEPGKYILEVVANDATGDGGGGFECCWSNGLVTVTVTSPHVSAVSGGN
jgi:hypothetical protein